jgi:hypothetical protein
MLVAHANGTGWDEMVILLVPFVFSLTIFVVARRHLRTTAAAANMTADTLG